MNISEMLADPVVSNRTLNPWICDCSKEIAETMVIFGPRMFYMASVTLAVIIYMAITLKYDEERFDNSIKWCIFILIISTFWIFEISLRGVL